MALITFWTKQAEKNFGNIITYLNDNFGEITSQAFVNRFFIILDSIQKYPELGSLEVKDKAIRGILITKHNILFYRFTVDKLILLNIFDT